MMDLVEFLRVRHAERAAKARALMGDTPGRWVAVVDEHHEYVEVLGALRDDAKPGDGYWYAICSWDIAAIAGDTGTDDLDGIERDCLAKAEHMAANDPVTVLREVEAEGRIIDEHTPEQGIPYHGGDENDPSTWVPCCSNCQVGVVLEGDWPCLHLRLLALPYTDHPDYQQEWRP